MGNGYTLSGDWFARARSVDVKYNQQQSFEHTTFVWTWISHTHTEQELQNKKKKKKKNSLWGTLEYLLYVFTLHSEN